MKRIFITGMSGTGKSSVIEALRSRGFTAIDTDYDDWCEFATFDGQPEWIWREERMHALLTAPLTAPLFVSGCRANQRKFYEYFDYKILFSAPLEVMRERIVHRSSNSHGKSEAEWDDICRNQQQIQPLLRKSADFELDSSTMSVEEMADFLIELALK